jgi:hypothetical protein
MRSRIPLAGFSTTGAVVLALAAVALTAPASGAAPQKAGEKASIEYPAQPGQPIATVRNNCSSPITGLIIKSKWRSVRGSGSAGAVITFDPSTNDPAYAPIPGGGTREFTVGYDVGGDTSRAHPELKAVIFADGSTYGDPDWVAELRGVRRCFIEELAAVELVLTRAKENGLDNHAIISLVEERRSSLKAAIPENSATGTIGCRLSVELIDDTAVDNLKYASVSGKSGNPQKTIPVILGIFEKMRGKMAAVEAPPDSPAAGPKR